MLSDSYVYLANNATHRDDMFDVLNHLHEASEILAEIVFSDETEGE